MARPLSFTTCALASWLALLGSVRAQTDAIETPPAEAGTAQRAPAQPVISRAALEAAQKRFAHEPGVSAIVRAALQSLPKPRAQALASRARDAGWVPTLALRARRGQGVDLSNLLAEDAPELSTDDDLTLEAALTFQLDRVIFRSEEVALARQTEAEAQQRLARTREVVALYFERRRLQIERDALSDPSYQRMLRIAEIEALLDVFTNGAFRRMIASSRWTTAGSTPATQSRSPLSSRPAPTR